jgi:hypothetical protein
MSMGKGSGRRPPAISDDELKSNWDRVFPALRESAGGGYGNPAVDTSAQAPQITDT